MNGNPGWIAIQLLINCWVLSKKYQEFALLSALAKTRLAKILNTVETTTFFVDECHFPDASESSKLLQFQLDIPHPGVPPTINMVCSDFSTKNQKSNILFLPQAMHFLCCFPGVQLLVFPHLRPAGLPSHQQSGG